MSCLCRLFLVTVFPFFFATRRPPPRSPLFPYTTLFRPGPSLTEPSAIVAVARRRAACVELRARRGRSEEHTSELQSLRHLVCRLLLEKKKKLGTHTTAIVDPNSALRLCSRGHPTT